MTTPVRFSDRLLDYLDANVSDIAAALDTTVKMAECGVKALRDDRRQANTHERAKAVLAYLSETAEKYLEGPAVSRMNALTDALRQARNLLAEMEG